jgi:hypothetical protein
MVTVFGDKGKFGVAFCLAANFRDLFIHYNFFPLFGGFGQKDSGKSGLVLACRLSLSQLKSIELNTSTLGLSEG